MGARHDASEIWDLDALSLEVYRVILAGHDSSPALLARRLGAPVEEVQQRLEALARADLLRPRVGGLDQYRPVVPEVGLAMLVERAAADLEARRRQMEQGCQRIALVLADFIREPDADGEELIGLDAVQGRLELLAHRATVEILTFAPGQASAAALVADVPVHEAALSRGVRVRTLYEVAALEDTETTAHAVWLTGLGAELRTVPQLPLRMVVCDGVQALLPVAPEDSSAGAVLVRDPSTVYALTSLFETYWTAATPLSSGAATPGLAAPDALEPMTAALLDLLASGAKDEAVARSLGISVRTLHRLMGRVWDELGAVTRFQAGVHAVRAGLV